MAQVHCTILCLKAKEDEKEDTKGREESNGKQVTIEEPAASKQ